MLTRHIEYIIVSTSLAIYGEQVLTSNKVTVRFHANVASAAARIFRPERPKTPDDDKSIYTLTRRRYRD